MEGLQLSFITLPGVSTSYSITIGSTNNATKEVKIVSAKKYKKLKKRRKKKKSISISPVFEESNLTQFDKSPERAKRESLEMADNIAEGVDKFGDNNKAISYAFAKQEGKSISEEKKQVVSADYV